MDQNVNVAKKKSMGRSSTRKKDGVKVHRKIHKAEREKLKRDRMNELFIELSRALEPANRNVGKSCALTDAIRILRDLIAQVDSLKKENSTLLAESEYVAIEKNELKEENNAIEVQIKNLKNQIWRPDSSSYLQPVADSATQAAAPVVSPVFVVPLQNGLAKQIGPNVSKPHARYPSPSDSWPFSILTEQSRAD